MMSTRAHHSPTTPGAGQKPPTPEDPIASLVALEEKARRLLKRCRYEESAKTFKEVVDTLQLQRQAGPISISPCSSLNWGCSQEVMVSREVGALEGLAICHSRMLNDDLAETAQRQALALRCQAWEGVPKTGSSDSARALIAKKAAVPCLRNLASFVSNQGRHVDAEVVLRTVLDILDLRQTQPRRGGSGGGRIPASTPALATGEEPSAEPSEKSSVPDLETSDRESGSGPSPPSTEDTGPGHPGPVSSETQGRLADDTAGLASPRAATMDASEPGAETAAEYAAVAVAAPPATTTGGAAVTREGSSPGSSPSSQPQVLPTTTTKQPHALVGRGGGHTGCLVATTVGSGGGGGDGGSGSKKERDLEDLELEEVVCESEENVEQMAAVTRHHLAVVIHAQGRAKEAIQLLGESVATLRRTAPPQPVWLAQALHDLAGVVRSSSPAHSCALYREALNLFESARGVNHFLTAPTLAKLGSLLGDSCIAAAAIPPAPAAPAGPGAAGVARAAGLAEAVCAPGEQPRGSTPSAAASAVEAVAAAAGSDWDAKVAEAMIKRAVLIQGRHLGLRHPAVASSMRAMAELYRKQGRLSEAEPLLRRAIGIWEASPGPMDADAVAALHGLAHCVLAGAGADWLGRFEEAFDLVDQAYRIASSPPGNLASSRLLLEALRMIRSRQRQGRGEPQPASTAIMDGVWSGRWDPANNADARTRSDGSSVGDGASSSETGGASRGHVRSSSSSSGCGRVDSPRCAVCLEEIGWGVTETATVTAAAAVTTATPDSDPMGELGGTAGVEPGVSSPSEASGSGVLKGGRGGAGRGEEVLEPVGEKSHVGVNIGSEEAVRAETEDSHARGRFAYLPCGHRFHTFCIGRWLAYSSSCPSCRSRVDDETAEDQDSSTATDSDSSPDLAAEDTVDDESPLEASRSRRGVGVPMRSVATQARADDGPGIDDEEGEARVLPGGNLGGDISGGQGRSDGRAPFC